MPAAYPTHLTLLYFISLRAQVMNFLLKQLSLPSCQFSLLGPNIFLITLFGQTNAIIHNAELSPV
jgi:hypothetical protein